MVGADFDDEDETRRLAEASAWRVALFEADLEATADFETWLAADLRNAEALRQVSGTWDRFGEVALEPEFIIARRDALERARRHRQRRFAGSPRWNWSMAGIAASLLVLVLAGPLVGFGLWRAIRADVYQTALGERRTVTLSDGSRIALDSDSLLKVRLGERARLIDLVRGQARFDVAHDARRPFTVHARDKTVVATGTSFNVDLMGANVIVTLIEGRVSILQDRPVHFSAAAAQPAPVLVAKLVAGQQLIAPGFAPGQPEASIAPVLLQKASIERATSWETGQLVFDNEPLATVVARVGRYSDRPIVADENVSGLKVSGVFDAGDLTTFVDAVQRVLPVAAETTQDGAIHLRSTGRTKPR